MSSPKARFYVVEFLEGPARPPVIMSKEALEYLVDHADSLPGLKAVRYVGIFTAEETQDYMERNALCSSAPAAP